MKLYPNPKVGEGTPAATHESIQRTGFVENWNAAFGLAYAEDLPLLSPTVSTSFDSQRKKLLLDYAESGDVPQGIMSYYGKDYDGAAKYARDVLGLEGFMTDEDFDKKKNEEFATWREYSQSVFAKADTPGKIAQFGGTLQAMATDPLYGLSALTGYGAAATIGGAALRVGLTEMAVEAMAVARRSSWKEKIGADYFGPQKVADMAFAGIGGAAIAAGSKALGKMLRPKDLTVGEVTDVLTKLEAENPELTPVLNSLRHADPEDNALKVMKEDEAFDARMNEPDKAPPEVEVKAAEAERVEEEAFIKRQPQRLMVEDRVNVLEKTSPEKIAKFSEEAKQASQKVKKATKKYNKAKERASKLRRAADVADDSVAGMKAKKASTEAEKALAETEANLTKATEAETTAKALAEEATSTAPKPKDEGVPRGTPKDEPDLRHPLVKEADAQVDQLDATLQIMEECL